MLFTSSNFEAKYKKLVVKDLILYLVHGGVVDIFIVYCVSSKQLASCCVTLAAVALANTVSPYSIPNQKGKSDKVLGACDTCQNISKRVL